MQFLVEYMNPLPHTPADKKRFLWNLPKSYVVTHMIISVYRDYRRALYTGYLAVPNEILLY